MDPPSNHREKKRDSAAKKRDQVYSAKSIRIREAEKTISTYQQNPSAR